MTRIDYGNGTAVVRQYDTADRPTLIRYEDAAGNAYLALAHEYTADGLVSRITETDEVSEAEFAIVIPSQPIGPIVAQVDFEYDARNRLTRESRTVISGSVDVDLGPAEYDLSYTYDAGGNRLTKTHRAIKKRGCSPKSAPAKLDEDSQQQSFWLLQTISPNGAVPPDPWSSIASASASPQPGSASRRRRGRGSPGSSRTEAEASSVLHLR